MRRLSRTWFPAAGAGSADPAAAVDRWRRASSALGKAQGRVADQRRDALHKATTGLTGRFGTLVIEDLNVAGMIRNRRLARQVADASIAEFRREIQYKTAWRGGTVVVADRWFASSKTCSGCGAVKAKLLLSDRAYVCTACGMVADRNRNAALNLAAYGEQIIAGSGPEINGRGAGQKTPPWAPLAVKRQPGHRASGSDRDRPTARQDCGMSAHKHSSATVDSLIREG